MTRNQQRALDLAVAIIRGIADEVALSEPDWHLLLLAAGMNKTLSDPLAVCGRVLDQAQRREGYFQNVKPVTCDRSRTDLTDLAIVLRRENTYVSNRGSPKLDACRDLIHLKSVSCDNSGVVSDGPNGGSQKRSPVGAEFGAQNTELFQDANCPPTGRGSIGA